jgi:hypothetical protein
MHPSGEMWANAGHAVNPEKLAFAVGADGIRLAITALDQIEP